MSKRTRTKHSNITHIANLLASILLCYPEIATINFDSKTCIARFTFYLSDVLSKETMETFHKHLLNSYKAYFFLEHKEVKCCSFTLEPSDFFTIVEFQRDVQTLSEKEISLFIALLKESFNSYLVVDENEDLLVDNSSLHEELINFMLENTKKTNTNTNIKLVALRDEGKVVVFNK